MSDLNLRDALGPGGPEPKVVAAAIVEDPNLMRSLVGLFLTSDYRISQRASNVFMALSKKRPELVAPHVAKLFRALEGADSNVALRRNVVRILQEVDVPENLAGAVFTTCLAIVGDPREAIATRAFAVTTAARIARNDADLRRELTLILDHACRHGAPKAVRFRANKFLSEKTS